MILLSFSLSILYNFDAHFEYLRLSSWEKIINILYLFKLYILLYMKKKKFPTLFQIKNEIMNKLIIF